MKDWLEKYRTPPPRQRARCDARCMAGPLISAPAAAMLHRKQQQDVRAGTHHETEVIGRAGPWPAACCSAATPTASAQDYPEPPGEDRHRVLAVRRDRRAGPLHRRQAQRDVGPAGRGREPPRRRRQHRRGGRGARRRPTATRCISARRRSRVNVTLSPTTAFDPVDELRADHAGAHRAGDVHGGECRRRSNRSRT